MTGLKYLFLLLACAPLDASAADQSVAGQHISGSCWAPYLVGGAVGLSIGLAFAARVRVSWFDFTHRLERDTATRIATLNEEMKALRTESKMKDMLLATEKGKSAVFEGENKRLKEDVERLNREIGQLSVPGARARQGEHLHRA